MVVKVAQRAIAPCLVKWLLPTIAGACRSVKASGHQRLCLDCPWSTISYSELREGLRFRRIVGDESVPLPHILVAQVSVVQSCTASRTFFVTTVLETGMVCLTSFLL